MEHRELEPGHRVDEDPQHLRPEEVPGDVDAQPSPGEARRVLDHDAGDDGGPVLPHLHELLEARQRVEQALRTARGDLDALRPDVEPVGLELPAVRADAVQPQPRRLRRQPEQHASRGAVVRRHDGYLVPREQAEAGGEPRGDRLGRDRAVQDDPSAGRQGEGRAGLPLGSSRDRDDRDRCGRG